MNGENAAGGESGEKTYVALDPVHLEPGDYVIVDRVAGEEIVRGEVIETATEWGRVSVTIRDEETGEPALVWDDTGKTFTQVLEEGSA